MNKESIRCYICYLNLVDHNHYHSRCLKKLFNQEYLPELDFSTQNIEDMALDYIKAKKGLPGVQKKLSLSLETPNKATSRLTIIGFRSGEYILKPPTSEYPQMPEIEDLTMHLAEIAKIAVPPHGLIKLNDDKLAYIIKRFDRKGKKKIAVEDLCQLSLKMTEDKYKSSSENMGKILRKYSTTPGDDALKLFELILFCYITGNADMHLKNFSLLTHDANNIKLAPAYDLLSTKLLIPEHIDPEQLALPLNGKKSNLRRKDFLAFSAALKIPDKVTTSIISKMMNKVPEWENKINQSFLNQKNKKSFNTLIIKNFYQIQ